MEIVENPKLKFTYCGLTFTNVEITDNYYVYGTDEFGRTHCFAPGIITIFEKI